MIKITALKLKYISWQIEGIQFLYGPPENYNGKIPVSDPSEGKEGGTGHGGKGVDNGVGGLFPCPCCGCVIS